MERTPNASPRVADRRAVARLARTLSPVATPRRLSTSLAAKERPSACVLAPRGLDDERERADAAGAAWRAPLAERTLPELAPGASLDDVIARALVADGDLEAAWHAWRAALARVRVESTWPMPNVEVGLERVVSGGEGSGWDRTSAMVGFDALDPFDWPSEARTRGSMALSEARATGERFRAARAALRREVLETWYAWQSSRARARFADASIDVLELGAASARRASGVEGDVRELVRVEAELARARDERTRLAVETRQAALELATRLALPDADGLDALFPASDVAFAPRAQPLGDDALFAAAARRNPELAEMAAEVAGRADALELARAAWLPDVRPSLGFMGDMERSIGLALTLPTAVPVLRGRIEAARADVDAAEARARQAGRDVRARLAAELIALREAEREAAFLATTLRPALERLRESARAAYAAGRADQREWLEALRLEVEARDAEWMARVARETSLARIEEILGDDVALVARAEAERGERPALEEAALEQRALEKAALEQAASERAATDQRVPDDGRAAAHAARAEERGATEVNGG